MSPGQSSEGSEALDSKDLQEDQLDEDYEQTAMASSSSAVSMSVGVDASEVDVKPKLDKTGGLKKKRKQLVACDSCRLRRVRCNKSETGAEPCGECARKGVKCTDSYIKQKPKIYRTGKLIQQAKILYGAGQLPGNIKSPGSSDDGSGHPEQALVRAAEARFVDSAMAQAISGHLIQTFKTVIQPQCPVVDWDSFENCYDAAGRNVGNMSPCGQILAAVIQAWGARYSDHSAIIGPGAPSLCEVQKHPERDSSHYGRIRTSFAKIMMTRAVTIMDEQGGLRKASISTTVGCVWLEFLLSWCKVDGSPPPQYMMMNAVEHLRNMSEGHTDDPADETLPDTAAGGTLFWMTYTRDALSALFRGRAPCITENDFGNLCSIITNPISEEVAAYVTSQDAMVLSGLAVMALFRHVNTIARDATARVTGPLAHRQPLRESAVRETWAEIDQSCRYTAVFEDSIRRCPWPKDSKFPRVRDLYSMQAQLNLAINISLVERVKQEEKAQINSSEPLTPSYLPALRRLRAESEERLLERCRVMARVAHEFLPDLLYQAAMMAEHFPAYVKHIIEMPVWEQGGPESWPLVAKQEDLSMMMNACRVYGYCWPEYKSLIEDGESLLAQLALQAEHLRASASVPMYSNPNTNSIHPYPPTSNGVEHNAYPNGLSHFDPDSSVHFTYATEAAAIPAYSETMQPQSSRSTHFEYYEPHSQQRQRYAGVRPLGPDSQLLEESFHTPDRLPPFFTQQFYPIPIGHDGEAHHRRTN